MLCVLVTCSLIEPSYRCRMNALDSLQVVLPTYVGHVSREFVVSLLTFDFMNYVPFLLFFVFVQLLLLFFID